MHNHYIINGSVEFHPATSTLRDLNNPEHVVVLNSPAGRCLLLLIKRIGTIVAQQEFMETVWEKSGMLVSPNTFYQNISILRKGLKKIGLDDDPVVTIPRIGLTLASGTQIKKLTVEKPVVVIHENAHFNDEGTLIHELPAPQRQEGREEQETTSPARQPEPPPVRTPQPVQADVVLPPGMTTVVPKPKQEFALWSACAVILVAMIFWAALSMNANNVSQHFSDYRFLATANGCNVFVADKNASREDKTSAMSFSEQFKASCASYPWVYVTYFPILPRVSVIRCDKPMSEPATCISDYFSRAKDASE